jgi:hypothetical protein
MVVPRLVVFSSVKMDSLMSEDPYVIGRVFVSSLQCHLHHRMILP